MSENLPRPENRIRIDRDDRVILEPTENNMEAHHL
jgi:translation initiation factor IF-1